MAGRKSFASLEYQVSAGGTTRWYLARATPFQDTGGAVVTHTDITDRMMSRLVLEDANRRMQTLSRRVLAVQEEERRTISRELHGDLGDSLSALKMGLHRLADGEAAPRSSVLEECLAAADSSLERLRTLAHELRPPQLDQLGLPEALDWLARHAQEESGVAVQFRVSGLGERRVPAAIENACYRVAQEGVRNALRQGQARHVGIELDADGRTLKLSIRHDGAAQGEEALREGAERPVDGGLISMEERVRLAGGRLKTRSVAGVGTVLSAFFPLTESAHA